MNPIQLMELHKEQFTPNDLLIYKTIIENPAHIVRTTTSTLAKECGVSQPALSRFVRGLGYTRFQDFRTDLSIWLVKQSDMEASDSHKLGYFHKLHQVLEKTEELLTDDYMKELAAYIRRFDHIYASGIGKSYHAAELLQTLSWKNGQSIHAVHLDFMEQLSDFIREKDLLIIFSVSGRSSIMCETADVSGKILLITANPLYQDKGNIDRAVLLPYIMPDPETSSVSPVLFDIFAELLVSYLASCQT